MSTMTTRELAQWFGKRAEALLYSTTDELAALGLAPVCLTGSFAKSTGELRDRRGAIKALPLVADESELPADLAERTDVLYYQNGQDLVLPGELGGVSDKAMYGLVRLDDVGLHEKLVRVSCRGTVYEFVRYPEGWVMTRTEAA